MHRIGKALWLISMESDIPFKICIIFSISALINVIISVSLIHLPGNRKRIVAFIYCIAAQSFSFHMVLLFKRALKLLDCRSIGNASIIASKYSTFIVDCAHAFLQAYLPDENDLCLENVFDKLHYTKVSMWPMPFEASRLLNNG